MSAEFFPSMQSIKSSSYMLVEKMCKLINFLILLSTILLIAIFATTNSFQ